MAEAFRQCVYEEVFDVYLLGELLIDEDTFIDVNALSYTAPPTGHEPETVLDYMYREFHYWENKSEEIKDELWDLIETFESPPWNAKRYKDLSEQEIADLT
ncbi:hypothetical protein [Colwellia sp. KU-HH00111]|uniref:hypothetical protein n=1 Tax=Colwellia sp. KU-HH00111 TaxID=3127652 RepID=UPI003365AD2F